MQVQNSNVNFCKDLDNESSLDLSIQERIEHNLKYNDDTIFDNFTVFADVGNKNQKVIGSKDKFDAKRLLRIPLEEISVSDEEEQ